MDRILSGIETEYGLLIEGEGAEGLLDQSMALVRGFPGERLSFRWDYTQESPRRDLRGFSLDHLAVDPTDASFDEGRSQLPGPDLRSDQVLVNGARLYNDHGHPEYSTPEAWSSREAALLDRAGENLLLKSAAILEEKIGKRVKVYKNNTDFHGASYGTHESYLVPRSIGFDSLYQALLPLFVARQVLVGAGKVGSESGEWCDYQISQRADFFVEPVNAETLYRRPIFNTRDEPHADPRLWMRLHVICGDACMMVGATARKLELVKLAIRLALVDDAPRWRLSDPVRASQRISRSPFSEGRIDLEGGSWTTPREILESFLMQAEKIFDLPPEELALLDECLGLLENRFKLPEIFARSVDWAAKHRLISGFIEAEGVDWKAPMAQSLDLAYNDIDPDEGLFGALVSMGSVEDQPSLADINLRETEICEPTRALARGTAVRKFSDKIIRLSWSSIIFDLPEGPKEVYLPPNAIYPEALYDVEEVEEFIRLLQEIRDDSN